MGDAASGQSESIEGNVCISASHLKDRGLVDLTARNFPLTTDNRIMQWSWSRKGLASRVRQLHA